MKNDLVFAGVGGQGILTIAAIIAKAAMTAGLNVKQSEVHGMSQRGGAVSAHLRLSSAPIASDLIPEGKADVIVSVEPMEALRQVPMLNPETGAVITNAAPVKNIADYPAEAEIYAELKKNPRALVLDGDGIAAASGSSRAMNIVILGALSNHLDIPAEELKEAIRSFFARKGEAIVAMNLKAFDAGREVR